MKIKVELLLNIDFISAIRILKQSLLKGESGTTKYRVGKLIQQLEFESLTISSTRDLLLKEFASEIEDQPGNFKFLTSTNRNQFLAQENELKKNEIEISFEKIKLPKCLNDELSVAEMISLEPFFEMPQ